MSDNNIYFRDNDSKKQKSYKYTEQISSEQLNAPVGAHALGAIRNDASQTPASGKKKRKKKKSKFKKVLIAFFTVILILTVALTAAAIATVSYVLEDYTPSEFSDNEYAQEEALLYSDDVINILIIGMDTLSTEASTRSDTMMLFSVDTVNGQIKLTSFLRDTYSYIPGHGTGRLNAACTYGGAQLVCDTVEYNFGIRIDGYVKTGYDMFLQVIDAVGGITVPEIDETESAALAAEGFSIPAGEKVSLSGDEALAYCRIRKGQDDFYRTGRQREVISLVIEEAVKMSPADILRTVRDIAGDIECSFTKKELISLALKALPCLTGVTLEFTVPAPGTWHNETIDYQAVLVADFEQNKEKLNEFLYK